MLLSAAFTLELEGPMQTHPGFQDNAAGPAVLLLVPGLLMLLAGAVLALRAGGRARRIAVAAVAVPLPAFGVFRMTVLAPMLACDGSRISAQDDGSYVCTDL